jgi:hypothetical protein
MSAPSECRDCGAIQQSTRACGACGGVSLRRAPYGSRLFEQEPVLVPQNTELDVELEPIELCERNEMRRLSLEEIKERLKWERGLGHE